MSRDRTIVPYAQSDSFDIPLATSLRQALDHSIILYDIMNSSLERSVLNVVFQHIMCNEVWCSRWKSV